MTSYRLGSKEEITVLLDEIARICADVRADLIAREYDAALFGTRTLSIAIAMAQQAMEDDNA